MMPIDTLSNRPHKLNQKGYYEWWYIHFVPMQGGRINMVLHETDIFGLVQSPYISISLFLDNGIVRNYHRDLTKSEFITHKGQYLSVGDAIFDEDKEMFNFGLKIDDLWFSGCIQKLNSPAIVENGILFEDYPKKHMWIIQIPYGKFNAELKLKGVNYSLNGYAYQDHNWGNSGIQDHFREWIWGDFVDKEGAVAFYRIKTLDGLLIDRGILTSRTKSFTTTKLSTSFLNEVSTPINPEKLTADVSMNFPEYEGKLEFHLSPENLMRKRFSELYPGFRATYCRWSASGVLSDFAERRTLHGIAEYIYISRQDNDELDVLQHDDNKLYI